MRTGKKACICFLAGAPLFFAVWLGGAQEKPAATPSSSQGANPPSSAIPSAAAPPAARPDSPTPKVTAVTDPIKDKGWPREFKKGHAVLSLYQPQIDEWPEQLKLKGRAAFSYISSNTPGTPAKPIFGTFSFQADTRTDTEDRSVFIYNLEAVEMNFADKQLPEKTEVEVRELIPQGPLTISLDRMLAYIESNKALVKNVNVSMAPPPIFYSSEPAILLVVEGKPIEAEIKGTKIKFIVNANWDLLLDTDKKKFYLLHQGFWLTADQLDGTWKSTTKLPKDFKKLPEDERWKGVKKYIPAQKAEGKPPKVVLADRPSELIVTKGALQLVRIPKTQLSYVSNTESDVFFKKTRRSSIF